MTPTKSVLMLSGILLLALAGPLGAQESDLFDPSEALYQDAAQYADDFGVGLDEAVRRLRLQAQIGELDAWLSEQAAEVYAGLWIENRPDYKVVVRFTDLEHGPRLLESRGAGPVAGLIEVRPARWTLTELEAAQAEVGNLARRAGLAVDSQIDVRSNRVEVFALETAPVERALAAKAGLRVQVRLVEVGELARPQANLRGGRPLSPVCTSGFTVRHSSGEYGITTAGHCGNSLYYQDTGTYLPFRAEDRQGNQDVQWHAAPCSLTVTNQFDTGIGIRSCTGTLSRSSQPIGAYVCKHGKATGYTCGNIISKSVSVWWVTNSQSTFIRVHDPNDQNLSSNGDSGGPWFVETIAYGIHSGEIGSTSEMVDALYMAINYISSLGLSVLTYAPSTGAPSTSLFCNDYHVGSLQVWCLASTSGGRSPYSYSWSYTGDADFWGSSGSWAGANYYSGCPYGGQNNFSVTVTDACGQQDSANAYPDCWESCPDCPE